TADYVNTMAPVTIDLTVGKAVHSTGTDTLIGIEQFRGTNTSDGFIGNEIANWFQGMDGNDVAFGGAGADTLVGDGGRDTLDGGIDADTMQGGRDDDIYVSDNLGDVVIENADEGVDTVRSSIDYTLGANVENLALTGTATVGIGNGLANIISGNSAA